MKEITTAKEAIDLSQEVRPHTLRNLNAIIHYKRMSPIEAVMYIEIDPSIENLKFLCLTDAAGKKLFKNVEEAEAFEVPLVDWSGLMKAINDFNFPSVERIAKN